MVHSLLSDHDDLKVGLDSEQDVEAPDDPVMCGRLRNFESLCQLDSLLSHLPTSQRAELVELIKKFPMLFGDTPTCTTLIEHDIDDPVG